ncbi:MAG: NADH-ubiquinone oxidoreductase-F iron-sulfur binding region domain-containing protein [Acidobacteriota bacterium]|nr:NADH-ubiquinone oxidoreductase-F iron-sulfur binding region domain-containing protein [Acidobacteriota bacterium]
MKTGIQVKTKSRKRTESKPIAKTQPKGTAARKTEVRQKKEASARITARQKKEVLTKIGAKKKTASQPKTRILVCESTTCLSLKSAAIREALEKAVAARGLGDKVEVGFTGCHGFCQVGPIVSVEPKGILYCRVNPGDADDIAASLSDGGRPVERLFFKHPVTKEVVPRYEDIVFYKKQRRIILRNCGLVNPERIEDYEERGGYGALRKAVSSMSPEKIVDKIKRAGLRGRGGAGFPTWIKWDVCRRQPGGEKYVIANANESAPGAFMDRSLLEADPHTVIEGLALLGYAVGAAQGYIYCRAEYSLAARRAGVALEQAAKKGYLGKGIFGSKFDFDVEIFEGGGTFVSGEETALLSSLEGSRNMPRPRPPYPAEKGLWGKPTVIDNVKTLACVPTIIAEGAEKFAASGNGNGASPGTTVFALTGKVANAGIAEVPLGTPLSTLIYEIGGGIPGKKGLKAVQTGGPSGGFLPGSKIEIPLDFDALEEAGSIMGSSGIMVMDDDACLVDAARTFLAFVQSESCGKCVACRVGTRHMVGLLDKIAQGKAVEADLDRLEKLGNIVRASSLCGLGKTAPIPALTALRYFRSEFIAHVVDKRCPAAVCRDLITFRIIPDRCTGCMMCVKVCPTAAITGPRSKPHNLDQSKCIKCRSCYEVCKFDAVAGEAIIIVS